jgi:hypothetical protein
VLASALPATAYQRTGAKMVQTYGGGTVFDGELATAVIAVGAAATPEPVVFEIVDRVYCAASNPTCPAAVGESALTDAGTMGILGTGMRGYAGGAVFTPLAQLDPAMRSYVVHFDASGGTLTIGPPAATLATFSFVQLAPDTAPHPNGAPAWNDLAVPVCFAVAGTPVAMPCAAETLVDSGTNANVLADGDLPAEDLDGSYLAAGVELHASIAGVLDWDAATTKNEVYARGLGSIQRILGMPFFEAVDVAYDLQAGKLGFRARP